MGRRPLGITVMGALAVLGGLGLVLVGVANLLAFLAAARESGATGLPPGAFLANGLVTLFLGALWFLRGRGLLRLRPWAWWVTTLPIFIGVVLAFLALSGRAARESPGSLATLLLGLLFLLVFLGYFLAVRRHFRRGNGKDG